MNKTEELIRKYLQQGRVMQLATVKDGQPWCCNVHYVFDEQLNLYWASLPTRRHSQEIRDHSKVAAAIAIKPQQPVIGMQIEGIAEQLTNSADIEKAAKIYYERYKSDADFFTNFVEDFVSGVRLHKFYRIAPKAIVLFDEVDFPQSPRQEFKLNLHAQ